MLLTMTAMNFRSFADEATLDLQQRAFQTLRPRPGSDWIESTVRRAAILGSNGSGKSNVVRPLGLLHAAVANSLKDTVFVKGLRDPHLLRRSEPTLFEVEYVQDDIRFKWTLELDDFGIKSERLLANPQSRWRTVFTRERNELSFNANVKVPRAAKENIEQFMTDWALVFSAWQTVKDPGEFAGGAVWWKESLLPLIVADEADQQSRHRWLLNLAQDEHWLTVLRLVLGIADVGITDIAIENDAPENVKQLHIVFNRVDHADTEAARAEAEAAAAQVVENTAVMEEFLRYMLFKHSAAGESFELRESEESQGTRAWVDLVVPAFMALATGRVLAVDEIDSSLHPLLVRELVGYFGDPEINVLGAQLLFTTHDVTLVGRHPVEILDRAEVWFVEKKDSFSELFALDEFPVRENHNIEKRYLQGSFGAVPIADRQRLGEALAKIRTNTLSKPGSKRA